MPEQRIRGEQVQIRVTTNGVLERTITAIESMTWTVNTAVISKGYLGENTERKDEIYKGQKIELSFDSESADGILLMALIADRAARRSAATNQVINIIFVANYPNGQRPRVTVQDVKFEGPSLGMQNRESYVSQRLVGESGKMPLIGGV